LPPRGGILVESAAAAAPGCSGPRRCAEQRHCPRGSLTSFELTGGFYPSRDG